MTWHRCKWGFKLDATRATKSAEVVETIVHSPPTLLTCRVTKYEFTLFASITLFGG